VISGGGKGAEQTYKRLAQENTESTAENLFINFPGPISGVRCVSTLLNRLFRNSQREKFFHQRMKFCQIPNVCRDILISVRVL